MQKETTQQRLKQIMSEENLRQVDIIKMSLPFQEELGIKMPKSYLSNYVNGYSSPDSWRLTLLAKTLGVSETWLMGYDVPKNGTSYAEKRIEEIENEAVYDYSHEALHSEEYFDNKRFIAEMEGKLLDKVGKKNLEKVKKTSNKYVGTMSETGIFEDIDEDEIGYFLTLNTFQDLGLGLEDSDEYEPTSFEANLLDLNINYFLLNDTDREDLMKYIEFLMSKHNK